MACGNDADCACDFSAVDGFRLDAHADIRREAQRQTRRDRDADLSKLPRQVPARARTAQPALVAWTVTVLALPVSLRATARGGTAALGLWRLAGVPGKGGL